MSTPFERLAALYGATVGNAATLIDWSADTSADQIDTAAKTLAAIRRHIREQRETLNRFLDGVPDDEVGRRAADAWEREVFSPEIEEAATFLGVPSPTNSDDVATIQLAINDRLAGLDADEAEVDAAEAEVGDHV